MSKEQKNKMLKFLKMNAVENDFIIFDARIKEVSLSALQIQKLSNRKNIGCDQLVIIKNSTRAECFIEIYNQDGSRSAVCGNATRCVAAIIMEEKNLPKITIDTAAGLLKCWRTSSGESVKNAEQDLILGNLTSENNISVEMNIPVFEKNFSFNGKDFFCVNMGNPHAINFANHLPQDDDFFSTSPAIENHEFFPNRTNVEFAKIASDKIIEVRVWERGAGETMACGSGACAVAAAAIKNNLIKSNKVITRFKGGDLQIEWHGSNSPIIMTGGYSTIFSGTIDEKFL